LHVKNVGKVSSGNLDDFIDTYDQPPLSKFFALVDGDVEGLPDIQELLFITQGNPDFYSDSGTTPDQTLYEWKVYKYFLNKTVELLNQYINLFYMNMNDTLMHFDTFYTKNKQGF
jgi:hypothetical protein